MQLRDSKVEDLAARQASVEVVMKLAERPVAATDKRNMSES